MAIEKVVSLTGETTLFDYADENDGSNAGKTLSPTSVTDGRGHVTSYAYNAQGRATSVRTDSGGSYQAAQISY